MILHIVDKENQDDTICGEETCRHCPKGFLDLDRYREEGFKALPYGWTPCYTCQKTLEFKAEVARLTKLIHPDCINGHDWPELKHKGFILQRNCKNCWQVDRV